MRTIAKACLAALLAGSQVALAAGLYITEVATPGSLGTAGVGNATNTSGADTVWTNPAGMTGVDQAVFETGMSLAIPSIEFSPNIATGGGSDGGNGGGVAPVPGMFYVRPLGERTRFGFSLTAPLGGGIDYENDFAGRYSVISVGLTGLGVSGAVGHKLTDSLSVGAGVSMVYTLLNEDIAINQGAGQPDAKVRFKDLDDIGFQGYFGLTWQATERLMLGAVYRTEFDAKLKGKLKIDNLAIPINDPGGSAKLTWTNPQWLDLGLRFQATDELQLMLSGGWQDWSKFSSNQLSVTTNAGRPGVAVIDRKWDDTWYLGVAMQKRFGPNRLLSMGVKYDSSPVSDANRTLDLPFDYVWTTSANYAWTTNGRFDYAVGGALLYGGDADIDQTSQGVRVKGDYDSNWILFIGGNLRYKF